MKQQLCSQKSKTLHMRLRLEQKHYMSYSRGAIELTGSPLLFFLLVNTGLALLASLPVVLFAPEAAGSGIPEVMGYLNGVHIRKMLRMRTLIAKVWGTVMVVSSGMALGKYHALCTLMLRCSTSFDDGCIVCSAISSTHMLTLV